MMSPARHSATLGFVLNAAGEVSAAAEKAKRWSEYVQEMATKAFQEIDGPRVGETVEVDADGRVISVTPAAGAGQQSLMQAAGEVWGSVAEFIEDNRTAFYWGAAALAAVWVIRKARR